MPVRHMWNGKFHSCLKKQISAENLHRQKSKVGRGDDRFGGFKNLIHGQERCVTHTQ